MTMVSRFIALLITLSFLQLDHQAYAEDLESSGVTVSLGSIPYYIPGNPIASENVDVYATCSSRSQKTILGLIPITVVDFSSATFSLATLATTVAGFQKQDDVWSNAFLSGDTSDPQYRWFSFCRQATNRASTQLSSSKVYRKKF